MKIFLLPLLILYTTMAFASISIECGTDVNKEDGTVGKRTFQISSETNTLSGKSGADWKLLNAKGKEVNGTLKNIPDGPLILTVLAGQGLGGPVGTKYTIEDPKGSNFTKAHVEIVGGFAGGTKTGDLDCVVSEN